MLKSSMCVCPISSASRSNKVNLLFFSLIFVVTLGGGASIDMTSFVSCRGCRNPGLGDARGYNK